jgi:hypothetical protein
VQNVGKKSQCSYSSLNLPLLLSVIIKYIIQYSFEQCFFFVIHESFFQFFLSMDNIVGSQYFLSFNFVFVLLMKSRIQYDLRNLIHSPSLRLSRTDFDPLEFNSVHYNLRVTSRNPSFESMRLRSERNPHPQSVTLGKYLAHLVLSAVKLSRFVFK